jgi:hypothetical protein
MLSNLEKFSPGTNAYVESQFSALKALGGNAVESGQKAIALNLATTMAFAAEWTFGAPQLVAAKSLQEFFAIAGIQAKLNAEKAASYGHKAAGIVSGINADLAKGAQVQIAEPENQVAALKDEAFKSAPAGSKKRGAPLTKQAVETVEADAVKATEQMSQAEKNLAKCN